MAQIKLFFCIIGIFLKSQKISALLADQPVVLVVSFDGVRYDYSSLVETPNLDALKTSGVSVPYMRPQLPTKTFPNHQSIATGLYTESHGISDNTIFDPVLNTTLGAFVPEFWNYREDVVPIWTINEWNGGTSGTIMWPGSNHPYGPNATLPTHFQRWNGSWSFEDRIDTMIEWVQHPNQPANVLFLYLEEPDGHCHAFGPNSEEVKEQIRLMDGRVGYLIKKLEEGELFDKVNLILLSDHGFVEIEQKNIMNVSDLVDTSLFERVGGSPVHHIFPKQGNFDQVYASFVEASQSMNFSVYKKEEIPEAWHFKGSSRVGPIVLVSDLGYVFDDFYGAIEEHNADFNLTASDDRVYGHHGFDEKSEAMRTFFLAHGPAFKEGVELQPFDNVDVVSLISYITQLPSPPTNGSIQPFTPALKSYCNESEGCEDSSATYFAASSILVIIAFAIVV